MEPNPSAAASSTRVLVVCRLGTNENGTRRICESTALWRQPSKMCLLTVLGPAILHTTASSGACAAPTSHPTTPKVAATIHVHPPYEDPSKQLLQHHFPRCHSPHDDLHDSGGEGREGSEKKTDLLESRESAEHAVRLMHLTKHAAVQADGLLFSIKSASSHDEHHTWFRASWMNRTGALLVGLRRRQKFEVALGVSPSLKYQTSHLVKMRHWPNEIEVDGELMDDSKFKAVRVMDLISQHEQAAVSQMGAVPAGYLLVFVALAKSISRSEAARVEGRFSKPIRLGSLGQATTVQDQVAALR